MGGTQITDLADYYELTSLANVADSSVAEEILAAANGTLPIQEYTFLADKGYDSKAIYRLDKDVYDGEAVVPLNTLYRKLLLKLFTQSSNDFFNLQWELVT